MKRIQLSMTLVVVCALLAGNAIAQELVQPTSVRSSAFEYDYYALDADDEGDGDESPSDRPIVDQPEAAAADCGGCRSRRWGRGCKDPCEAWRLIPTTGRGIDIYGWIDAGATANAQAPVSRYNGPVSFNDRDELQLNQLYLVMEKALDPDPYGWQFGGRLDLLYGTDYIFTQEVGWETDRAGAPKWNTGAHYGLAMPQAYLEMAKGDLSLKLGRFYTILGYENVMAPNNFFYSHAYTMQYAEPFTHSGVLATWKYSDRLELIAGVVNGWDRFDAFVNRGAFIGGVVYTPCHERYSLALSFITGDEDNGFGVQTNRTAYSFVFDYQVTDNLQYVLQHDNVWQENVVRGAGIEGYGINQYLLYTLNDCWKAGLRFEWFRDDDGFAVGRAGTTRATNPYASGSTGDFFEVTLGLNWMPTANLNIRPELRWDWFEGAGVLPYDDNTKDNQFLAAFDVIWTF